MRQFQARKVFNILKTEKGKQLFYKLYGELIKRYRHRRGAYLFSLSGALNNFYTARRVEYGKPDVVNLFFWQSGFDLGVIAKDSQTGKETFIEL